MPGASDMEEVFQQKNYTENFVQATLSALGEQLEGATLVVGGDGRFFMTEATDIIIKMAAANKVSRLIVGKGGFLSTPAVSNLIRMHGATGGFILTASHNPGGPDADFGIKFNCSNGGPAPDAFTDRIHRLTQDIVQLRTCPSLACDFHTIGSYSFMVEGASFVVDVVDPVTDYVALMKKVVNFEQIKTFLAETDFKLLLNSMHGATGPYVEAIFVGELGCAASSCVKTEVLPDFGGGHPDPNLTYAADLVAAMAAGEHGLGAAFDGDGDRNMILGKDAFFVTPCDSLAVLADNLEHIPWFQDGRCKGVARSMPTSGAVDLVAEKKGVKCFDTPTGWKYFGNLLDDGQICLCGEESFGTGSDHIREKDGIWAALAWLQVLAVKKMSIEDVLREHWEEYGRNFFTRYDYEGCDSAPCNTMMLNLEAYISDPDNIGRKYEAGGKTFTVAKADNFSYVDPVDGSQANNQGIRIFFACGSRIVFRLSGTGSSGATVRMYVDSYEKAKDNLLLSAQDMLAPAVEVGLVISQLRELTGRKEPTVIT